MKPFRWSPDKNGAVKAERGVSFENVVVAIESGGLLDVLAHPNQAKYPRQRVLGVACDSYVYLVPFVEVDECFFLKTVVPSRKATRDYLNRGETDAEN
ncbi:MAG: toxin [Sulfuritalea sp.]|nr:toxin [Sulfuritalea sp.]